MKEYNDITNENPKKHSILRKLLVPIFVIFFSLIIGSFAYSNIEGWSLIDSIYFLTATMLTIGYGDIVPQTDLGKLFTVFFSWFSISMGLYGISIISSFRAETFDKRVNELSDGVENLTKVSLKLKNKFENTIFNKKRKGI